MTNLELNRLKELAVKANAVSQGQVVASCETKEWAEFIAAADPDAVLVLIDDLIKTKDALAHCRDKNSQLEKEADWLAEKIADAAHFLEPWGKDGWRAQARAEVIRKGGVACQ